MFAIEVGIFQDGRLWIGAVVDRLEVCEGGEVIAVVVLDDSSRLISVEIAVTDENVLIGLKAFFDVDGDEAVSRICVDGGDELAFVVGSDAEA